VAPSEARQQEQPQHAMPDMRLLGEGIGSQWVQSPRHGDPIANQKEQPQHAMPDMRLLGALCVLAGARALRERHGGPLCPSCLAVSGWLLGRRA
jgi:hypothetical protein